MHNSLGWYLSRKGKTDAAIASLRQAIALAPTNGQAYQNLAWVLDSKGRLDEAIAAYKKAVELVPRNAWGHTNLGWVLHRKGKTDEAMTCFRKAIGFNPRYVPAHNNLGRALLCKGKTGAAFTSFRKAIALDPSCRYDVACWAALAASSDSDRDRAARCRKQALAWLNADLAATRQEAASSKAAERTTAKNRMRHWQNDADFAGLRGREALAKLPETERALWHRLWVEVGGILKDR
jgi:tetratricopeptide (TPR) repeat protein